MALVADCSSNSIHDRAGHRDHGSRHRRRPGSTPLRAHASVIALGHLRTPLLTCVALQVLLGGREARLRSPTDPPARRLPARLELPASDVAGPEEDPARHSCSHCLASRSLTGCRFNYTISCFNNQCEAWHKRVQPVTSQARGFKCPTEPGMARQCITTGHFSRSVLIDEWVDLLGQPSAVFAVRSSSMPANRGARSLPRGPRPVGRALAGLGR